MLLILPTLSCQPISSLTTEFNLREEFIGAHLTASTQLILEKTATIPKQKQNQHKKVAFLFEGPKSFCQASKK